ncbi:MAG: M23 family metallopeptidase [Ferruginibacter sp.]
MKNHFFVPALALLSMSTTSFTSSTTSNSTETPATIAKQLYFPVAGGKGKVGSVWGDERDGGRRKHEGIDIFAPKGTALVAISDGVITVVRTDDIGGNNITLQPDEYSWNAYYAHLDKMYVKPGQWVSKGQLIGTVGNTGNAQTTTPHLHFGIYTSSGAIDPLPYVKSSPVISQPLPAKDPPIVRTTSQKKSTSPTSTSRRNTTGSQAGSILKSAAIQVLSGILQRKIRIGK